MIAREAIAAVKALPYPHDNVSNAEYSILLRAYDANKAVILAGFRDSLANEYAATLPASVQNEIWNKSCAVPGRHYDEVEYAYANLARKASN